MIADELLGSERNVGHVLLVYVILRGRLCSDLALVLLVPALTRGYVHDVGVLFNSRA